MYSLTSSMSHLDLKSTTYGKAHPELFIGQNNSLAGINALSVSARKAKLNEITAAAMPPDTCRIMHNGLLNAVEPDVKQSWFKKAFNNVSNFVKQHKVGVGIGAAAVALLAIITGVSVHNKKKAEQVAPAAYATHS